MIPVDWLNLGGLAVKSLYFGAPSGNQRWLAGSLKQIIELSIRKQASITLWLFNVAMENGPFIDSLPIQNGDFPWLC